MSRVFLFFFLTKGLIFKQVLSFDKSLFLCYHFSLTLNVFGFFVAKTASNPKAKKVCFETEQGLCFSVCVLCICVLLLGWSPQCPAVQFHLQRSSLSCIYSSHFTSPTYRFVHFPSCKTDISSSYITHIKWGMWQGQMRRRRKMRVLFTTYLSYLYEL